MPIVLPLLLSNYLLNLIPLLRYKAMFNNLTKPYRKDKGASQRAEGSALIS